VVVKAPLGLHKIEVKPIGDGEVRLFGLSAERSGGGVVYDSLGLTGSQANQQLKWDRGHWLKQAKWRSPDLFVIHYGTNESENERMSMTKYAEVLKKLIKRLRAVNSGAACLFVSPMDRAFNNERGVIQTRPIIPKIVKTQREVALAEGCAFWSAYDAMGGWGSLKRWYQAKPALAGGDLTHPTRRGANLLGAMMFSALMEAYGR
jgi:lysophospholipase L1-like esterase